MTDITLYNLGFEVNGIRIYVPNFDKNNQALGYDFCIKLIKKFRLQKKIHWAKEPPTQTLFSFLRSTTVKNYLNQKNIIDKNRIEEICEILQLNSNEKI